MTLYITPDNKLHDDAGGYASTLPSWPDDAVVATEEQIEAVLNPILTNAQKAEALKSALDVLERQDTSLRAIRETMIKLYEVMRPTLGFTVEQLAQLPAYKGFKELDQEAALIREQIRELS